MHNETDRDTLLAEVKRLREALEQAYGLLWEVPVDKRNRSDLAISTARKQLLKHIDKEGQRRGIEYARDVLERRVCSLCQSENGSIRVGGGWWCDECIARRTTEA